MKNFIVTFLVTLIVFGAGIAAFLYFSGVLPSPAGGGGAPAVSQSGSSDSSAASAPSSQAQAIPDAWKDSGIFSAWYAQAYAKLSGMTLEEKVGQMILARCPVNGALPTIRAYHLGGYLLFERDFSDKTTEQVISTLASYQQASAIPMLMAVDEEGGTIVRISSNPRLAQSIFPSPQQLFTQGGLSAVRSDALAKASLLKKLGLNVNLAPVSDVSTNKRDYIYSRAFGKPAAQTGQFVSTVVTATREDGLSSTLKHFPGYGNNRNTHTGIAVDNRPYSTFTGSDFIPFEDGIKAGAESILVAHTIVECMDRGVPASLSPAVHRILRNDLHFTGVIMTDDLSMDAIKEYTHNTDPSVKAVLAGNDLLIMTNYAQGYNAILSAVQAGTIPKSTVDHAVFRILAWKYAKGLIK